MTPYMKRFVYASLSYLGLAAVFGILDGTSNLGYFGSYAHTHFLLLSDCLASCRHLQLRYTFIFYNSNTVSKVVFEFLVMANQIYSFLLSLFS